MRRWQEIKIRQNRLRAEADNQAIPSAHIEQIMKSGFSMSDIKGNIIVYTGCSDNNCIFCRVT